MPLSMISLHVFESAHLTHKYNIAASEFSLCDVSLYKLVGIERCPCQHRACENMYFATSPRIYGADIFCNLGTRVRDANCNLAKQHLCWILNKLLDLWDVSDWSQREMARLDMP